MRGWVTLFTEERNWKQYRTGVLVATAEPGLVARTLSKLMQDFGQVEFTLLGPRAYEKLFTGKGSCIWLEDFKAKPLHVLKDLRKRRFDLAFVVLDGQPIFRKARLTTFLLRPLRFIICNENTDWFPVDRRHWKDVFLPFRRQARWFFSGSFLVPFGFGYLVLRTIRLCALGRLQLPSSSRVSDEH